MDIGGLTSVKRIYTSPVAARSDVPDGLSSGDLVALAGEAGGSTGHVHNGVYKVQSGAWEKLVANINTTTRYHVIVGTASTTGGNSIGDGFWVMRCVDATVGKYAFTRL